MDLLTLENLIDLREAITRRLSEIEKFQPASFQAKAEMERRTRSLTESFGRIEERIKDLQFESEKLPFDDTAHSASN